MYRIRFYRIRRDQYGAYINKQHSFYRTFNTLSEAARYLMVNDKKLLVDAFSLTKKERRILGNKYWAIARKN